MGILTIIVGDRPQSRTDLGGLRDDKEVAHWGLLKTFIITLRILW